MPKVCLLLVGSGPEAAMLEKLAQDSGDSDAVRFVGERDIVLDHIRAMDVFALPSRTEGLGLALIEAMACGVPVVASAVGGVPEVVVNNVSGLLVPPGEPTALGEAILRLLGDQELSRKLSVEALLRASTNFALERMIEQVGDLYSKLVKE